MKAEVEKLINTGKQLLFFPELSRTLSLRLNFTLAFVGNAVYSAARWAMVAMLAKLGSPDIVGQFSLGLAVSAPVYMLTNLQLRTVQATDAQDDYAFSDYLGLRLLMDLVAALVVLVIVRISGYHSDTALVVLLIGLSKAFESVSDVFYGLFQRYERMDRVAISMVLRGVLALSFLGLGVWISGGLVWGAVGLVLASLFVLLGYDVSSGIRVLRSVKSMPDTQIYPRWEINTLMSLTWLSLPLGIVMMLISLKTNMPRYFVESFLGEGDLGIFAAMAYLMVLGNQIVVALGRSASPRLANHYQDKNARAFLFLLLKLLGVGFVVGLLGIVVAAAFGQKILTILYQPEYARYPGVFFWLMVAAAINYMATSLGYAMTAARYFWAQIPLFVIVAAVTAIACYGLIPRYGLLGGAMAYFVSMASELMGSAIVVLLSLRALLKGD